jgi:hypothetical protein
MSNVWQCNECDASSCNIITVCHRSYQSDRCPARFRSHEAKWVRMEVKVPAPNNQQQLKQAIASAKESIDIIAQHACV